MKKCILIVEDDPAISRLIESNLLVAGYENVDTKNEGVKDAKNGCFL